MEKEQMEVLLEDIRSKVQIIAEGHDVLRSEMKDGFETVRSEMRQMEERLTNKFDIKLNGVHASLKNEIKVTALALKDEVREVSRKLDEHIRMPV